MTRPTATLAALATLWACAAPSATLDDLTTQRLVQAAQAAAEQMLQDHGRVRRFLVFLRRDGTTDLGNVDGGGNAPNRDHVQAIMERSRLPAGADVTFPGRGLEAQVDTMVVLCVGHDGATREVRVPLGRTVTRIGNTDR